MKIVKTKDKIDLSNKAYDLIENRLKNKKNLVLGLATGGSPLLIYKLFREKKPDTTQVTTINLDEYVGLCASNTKSYNYFMEQQLFRHLKIKKNYLPNGVAHNLIEECDNYEKIIENNPIDLQLLGIGENSHIAFNEPGTSFNSKTRVVDLKISTIKANSRYFEKEEDVPKKAITMGIGTILKAKEILLIAYGIKKARAIKELVEGNIDENFPATFIKYHKNVTVIADEEALSLCNLRV